MWITQHMDSGENVHDPYSDTTPFKEFIPRSQYSFGHLALVSCEQNTFPWERKEIVV